LDDGTKYDPVSLQNSENPLAISNSENEVLNEEIIELDSFDDLLIKDENVAKFIVRRERKLTSISQVKNEVTIGKSLFERTPPSKKSEGRSEFTETFCITSLVSSIVSFLTLILFFTSTGWGFVLAAGLSYCLFP